MEISTAIPSHCAAQLLNEEVDVALVPVAIIPQLDYSKIISQFCISSDGAVQTVCLFSDCPLDEIETIYLDYHSKTSNGKTKLNIWRSGPKKRD